MKIRLSKIIHLFLSMGLIVLLQACGMATVNPISLQSPSDSSGQVTGEETGNADTDAGSDSLGQEIVDPWEIPAPIAKGYFDEEQIDTLTECQKTILTGTQGSIVIEPVQQGSNLSNIQFVVQVINHEKAELQEVDVKSDGSWGPVIFDSSDTEKLELVVLTRNETEQSLSATDSLAMKYVNPDSDSGEFIWVDSQVDLDQFNDLFKDYQLGSYEYSTDYFNNQEYCTEKHHIVKIDSDEENTSSMQLHIPLFDQMNRFTSDADSEQAGTLPFKKVYYYGEK